MFQVFVLCFLLGETPKVTGTMNNTNAEIKAENACMDSSKSRGSQPQL